MFLEETAGFPDQNGYNDSFPFISQRQKICGEVVIYSIHQENHELKMFNFSFFDKFRYIEGRYYAKNFEPMILIFFKEFERQEANNFPGFSSWVDTSLSVYYQFIN